MAHPTILIVDTDPKSYQIIQKLFFNDQVSVVWGTILDTEQLNAIECSIILFSVEQVEDYERAFEMNRRFENAVMFLLAEQHFYDAFEARNAGAVGAFFKPLHLSRIYERIVELLPDASPNETGILDSLYVPTPSERRAKVVSFLPTSPVQDDLEAIVRDLLPLVVQQVLTVQLSTSTDLKRMLHEEISKVLQQKGIQNKD